MNPSTLRFLQVSILFTATCSFAIQPTPADHQDIADLVAQKTAGANPITPPDPIYVDVGGDTIENATVISGIPYSDSGNTCQFAHNYDAVCPYNLPGAPDVVYRFTPASNTAISIDLCTSDYDTKVYVYQNTVGNVIACNDDACGSDGFKSLIEALQLSAGNTYYIVVDGYSSTDCGTYEMAVSECCGCFVPCPSGALLEGEPVCHDNYIDSYNSGCNSTPPVFTSLPCSSPGETTTVCGEYGGFSFNGLGYRDTDWYQITLDAPGTITWCVFGEDETLVGVIDGNAGCPVISFYDYTIGANCMNTCLSENLPAGTWWLFVSTAAFGSAALPCGSNYVAELTGYDCSTVAVEPATWAGIKNLYR